MYNMCTLFDSFYLDKGLALYNSLVDTGDDFKLFIFTFDDKCYNVLNDLHLSNAELIPLDQFETDALKSVKKQRTKAEYCWTCTPWIIKHILEKYNVDMCTYIDSDLYFYKTPELLLGEILDNSDNIIITEHRFKKDSDYETKVEVYGKYCVEFNTFKNNEEGLQALNWWADRCLEWCYYKRDGNLLGDQKYLDHWTTQFSGVHELQNLGGGVAPWNLDQYDLVSVAGSDILLRDKNTGSNFDLVFYHFQNIRYITEDLVNIKSGTNNKKLKQAIYHPYLKEIERIRSMLTANYDINFSQQKICSTNPIVAFIQKNIMQFKCTSFSDIINLRKIR